MVLSDRMANRQVIGGLMLNPLLLLDYADLTPSDFDNNLIRICFLGIKNLFLAGATKLTVIEVDQEIERWQNNSTLIYQRENGLDFLKDSYEIAEISNFPAYYTRLKKMALLKRLVKEKYDVSEFYIEDKDIVDPLQAIHIQEHYDQASIEDILNSIESKYNIIRNDFLHGGKVKGDPAEGLDDLIEELRTAPNIGPSIEGKIFSSICRGARQGCFYLKSSSSGSGKALPNSINIPTPNGYKRVGDIKVGDYLFDAFGKPTKVLGVFPQGIKDVWEVIFKDGRKAHCCQEHLWSYCLADQSSLDKAQRHFRTNSLEDLNNLSLQTINGYQILVPMNYAVEYPTKEVYPSPYVMGALLGDGSFRYSSNQRALSFSSVDEELVQYIATELKCEYHKNSGNNHDWTFRKYQKNDKGPDRKNIWVEEILKNYPSLWQVNSKTKFIPDDYLFNSIQNRIELLNGLLDTDGTVDAKGHIEYNTISPQLRDNVVELCQSLGLKTSVYEDKHKETNTCYSIRITGRPEDKKQLFKLSRKKELIEAWYNNEKRKENNNFNPIVQIKKCDYKENMTCFYVDNEEHLFLTENYIVTHNTRTSVFDACRLAYPVRWSFEKNCFIEEVDSNGELRQPRKILFIITEMDKEELQTIMLAYLSGVNEEHILTGHYELGELSRVKYAAKIIERYSGNFIIEEISDPNLVNVEATIKRYATTENVKYVIFDYIHSTASMINQFAKNNLNEATILMMMANQLKQLAKDYNLFILSATQVNMSAMMDDGEFKNETTIRSSKAVADKADIGYVMTRVNDKIWNSMLPIFRKGARDGVISPNYLENDNRPTHILDIYKMRRGRYKNVRIWTKLNLGNGHRQDLFITTADNEPIGEVIDLFSSAVEIPNSAWESELRNDN